MAGSQSGERLPLRYGALAACFFFAIGLRAQEGPYFVTYSDQMEEPGNLEIGLKSLTGNPAAGDRFYGSALEFEYGATGWWTTEVYLDGQSTSGDSTLFTGYRWENRFHILRRQHWINPVLYLEFENINGADKTLLEVVNHDGQSDFLGSNAEGRLEKEREIESKLILSSQVRNWNFSENFIVEKNLRHEPWEFGYAVGISRPLGLAARPEECRFCPENFQAGVEFYGGLGTHESFGLRDTSHYVAPVISWQVTDGTTLRFSPGFGLTGDSAKFLLRVGMSYEIPQLWRSARRLFR